MVLQLVLLGLLSLLWIQPEKQAEVRAPISFENVELRTQQNNPFLLKAARARMSLHQNWQMSLYEIEPFASGNFVARPEELLFIPQNGQVILKRFDIPGLIEIDEIVIDPKINNISFYNLQAEYRYVDESRLHWENWKVGRLKSRDLLQHWSRLMTFFQNQKQDLVKEKFSHRNNPKSQTETVEHKRINYRVKLGELSLHQSILHFRIGAKEIKIETPEGVLESASGRLKLDPFVLTTASATLNQKRSIKRATFYLKTGELRLE